MLPTNLTGTGGKKARSRHEVNGTTTDTNARKEHNPSPPDGAFSDSTNKRTEHLQQHFGTMLVLQVVHSSYGQSVHA
jgi:hypothetical protein